MVSLLVSHEQSEQILCLIGDDVFYGQTRRDEWRHCVMVVYCVQSNETHLGGDHRCQQCGKQRRNDDLTRHHTAKALDQKYLYTENYVFFLYLLYWTGYQTLRKIEIFQSIELRCAVFTVRLFYIYSYIFFHLEHTKHDKYWRCDKPFADKNHSSLINMSNNASIIAPATATTVENHIVQLLSTHTQSESLTINHRPSSMCVNHEKKQKYFVLESRICSSIASKIYFIDSVGSAHHSAQCKNRLKFSFASDRTRTVSFVLAAANTQCANAYRICRSNELCMCIITHQQSDLLLSGCTTYRCNV